MTTPQAEQMELAPQSKAAEPMLCSTPGCERRAYFTGPDASGQRRKWCTTCWKKFMEAQS